MRRRTLLSALALALLGCLDDGVRPIDAQRPDPNRAHRVLFVGNSLTYSNDLPQILEALAAANGKSVGVFAVTAPGFSLEDHWADGTAAAEIATGRYTLVVLQQGPSALESSRELLRAFTRKFDAVIRDHGATPALYAVWPDQSRAFDFDRVHESYALAAADVEGTLFPVGEAWRAAWRIQPTLALWSSDGLHPTPAGSYAAALVMYARLFGEAAATAPETLSLASGRSLRVSAQTLATIRQAASEVGVVASRE